MNCERVKDLLADFLVGNLEGNAKAEIDAHLSGCASCREETTSLQAMWTKLASLPEEQPSPALDARFHAMLEAYRQGMKQAKRDAAGRMTLADWFRRLWPCQPAWQFAIAVALFTLGLLTGLSLTRPRQHDANPGSTSVHALAQLREEISSMKQLVTLSLLHQPSASERLRGMEWTSRLDQPDDQVLSALLGVLDLDPNVNVRLAAVGALQQFTQNARVRMGLVDALARQQSPLVQIGLINVLVRSKEKESVAVLKGLLQNGEINPTVRERIEWALQQLS